MSKRWIITLAFLVAAPAAGHAQFTTFIAPKNPVKDSIKAAVVAIQKAATDSVTRAQIADMKTWVDSAAGLVIPPVKDSLVSVKADTIIATTTVTNGMVAPATASPLPFLLVLGGVTMLMGAAMMRRPQPKQARIDET